MKKYILVLIALLFLCSSFTEAKEKPADFYFKQLKAIEKLIDFNKFEEVGKEFDALEKKLFKTNYEGLKLRFYALRIYLHVIKDEAQEAKIHLEKAQAFKETLKLEEPIKNIDVGYFYDVLGYYHENITGVKEIAILHYQTAIAIKSRYYSDLEHDDILKSRSLLAKNYYSFNDYRKLKLLSDDNIRIYESKQKLDTLYAGWSYRGRGMFWYFGEQTEFKNEQLAKEGSKKIFLLSKFYNYTPSLIIHNDSIKFAKSFPNFEKVRELYTSYFGKFNGFTAISHHNLGNCFFGKAKAQSYDSSIFHFEKGLEIAKHVFDKKHRRVGSLYNVLGGAYLGKSDVSKDKDAYLKFLKEALSYQQQGHNSKLTAENQTSDPYQVPVLEKNITLPSYMLLILNHKVVLINKLAYRNSDSSTKIELFKHALAHGEVALKYFLDFKKRSAYGETQSTYIFKNYLNHVLRNTVEAAVQLFELSQENKYLEKAFAYSNYGKKYFFNRDKSRNMNIRNSSSYNSRIDTLHKQIKTLKGKQKILEEEGFIKNLIAYAELGERILYLLKEKHTLEEDILSKTPLKEEKLLTIKEIQQKMEADVVLLDMNYLASRDEKGEIEHFLLSFLIAKDTVIVKKILAKDDVNIQKYIETFNTSINSSSAILHKELSDSVRVNEAREDYLKTGYLLYHKLLDKPFGKYIQDKKLVISMSMDLETFAWGALLTEDISKTSKLKYNELPYLIHKLSPKLYPSLNDYIHELEIGAIDKEMNVLAIASFSKKPTDEETEDLVYDFANYKGGTLRSVKKSLKLKGLAYSGVELYNMEKIIAGTFLYGEQEVDTVFKKAVDSADILHISTHAFSKGEERKIYFSQHNSDNKYICYTNDILKYDFSHLELVVLSACQSGTGEKHASEGDLSLANDFLRAGSKGVISNLWKVDDGVGQFIMNKFYEYLKVGKTKSEALRQAKLAYINFKGGKYKTGFENNNHYHPYLWCPTQIQGNDRAIRLASPE